MKIKFLVKINKLNAYKQLMNSPQIVVQPNNYPRLKKLKEIYEKCIIFKHLL